jgi:hypothetical protein
MKRNFLQHIEMKRNLIIACFILFTACYAHALEISSVVAKLNNNELYVTASLKSDPKFMGDMNEGLSKELIFYIDLFKSWNIWPDEFILGKKLIKTLKSNPIKREHTASIVDGGTHLEKRFKDTESMIEWAMSITDIKLTNTKELEAGSYFVKITVESRIRKLPPVVGYLLFFVPEKEFSISKDSAIFQINAGVK